MSDMSTSKETSKHAYAASATALYKYKSAILTVTNAAPGTPIIVSISTKKGTIVWSSGDPADTESSGINMVVSTGSLPLTSFMVTASQITFETAKGGSAVAFNLNGFLCASQDLTDFSATLQSVPSGAQVTLGLGGQKAKTLTFNTTTNFDWSNTSATMQ
ncbi:hypothetical protein EO087_14320 [Dyella sp. M7H15-1]|uniref:hypothetical protein n=1 Tax=Dyella sp. M7H15-1 TaxID=2501295 RepID=UPI001004D814|nr:hypothetical protein [Dyella sp. M7H15-1]QAU25024.1 hypothetical protein EO087_14320 [Dyella sp. M7H15-1]